MQPAGCIFCTDERQKRLVVQVLSYGLGKRSLALAEGRVRISAHRGRHFRLIVDGISA